MATRTAPSTSRTYPDSLDLPALCASQRRGVARGVGTNAGATSPGSAETGGRKVMPASRSNVSALPFPDPVETEFAKDTWDIRCIPGARYSPCRSQFFLYFTGIAHAFRRVVKRYIQLMIMRYSADHCRNKIRHLQIFLDFFALRQPGTPHFQQVHRADIEAYLIYLRTDRGKHWREAE